MSDLLALAQKNSTCAIKSKEDYQKEVFETIDNIILRASEYKDVTGIFLAQIISNCNRIFLAIKDN